MSKKSSKKKGKRSNKRKPIEEPEDPSRRRFLKYGTIGAGIIATPPVVHYLFGNRMPSLGNAHEVATYLRENGLLVQEGGVKQNGPNLVYYLPDIHISDWRAAVTDNIFRLHDLIGVQLIGIEGDSEIMDARAVQAIFATAIKKQKRGEYYDISMNNATLKLGLEPPEIINSVDDLLRIDPPLKLALKKELTLKGIEDGPLLRTEGDIYQLQWTFTYYFMGLREESFVNEKISAGELKGYRSMLREKMQTILYSLGGRNFPSIDEGIEHILALPNPSEQRIMDVSEAPFRQAVDRHIEQTKSQRSVVSVNNLIYDMQTRGARQAAVIYGGDHQEVMLEQLTKKGVSYIVIETGLEVPLILEQLQK